MKTLYFAYGSNMSQSRLEKRIGKVTKIGVYRLPMYKLAFDKGFEDNVFANIVMTGNHEDSVLGVIYELTARQLKTLDMYEGYPDCYQRMVFRMLGKPSHVYISINPLYDAEPKAFPKQEYLKHISIGYRENNLTWDAKALVERFKKIS